MIPHGKAKPKTQQRAKPNLYIETEFESEDDVANTVVLRLPDPINEYDESGEGGIGDSGHLAQRSIVESLQVPEQLLRRQVAPSNPMQQFAIGLKTLNIFQKLWKRRMLIESFNAMRLTRVSSLTRQQSQTDFQHKHSSSLVEPQRGRWALANDRSVNRIGSTHDESSMERARLLNEIVEKLSHRSSSRRIIVEQPILNTPSLVVRESESQTHHQRKIEHKLDRLQTMLKDIKRVHQASTLQSTIYSVKRPEPERRRKRKARQRDDLQHQGKEQRRSYLLREERERTDRQRLNSEKERLSRERREREFFERERLRLEVEREHQARLEAERRLKIERQSRNELNQSRRNESSQRELQLSKEIESLKQEVRHLKTVGESSSHHSQSPRHLTGGPNILKQLYDRVDDRSPHGNRVPAEMHPLITHTTHNQYTSNYIPYTVPLQPPQSLIQESRHHTHLSPGFQQREIPATYVQSIVTKSPVYLHHRSMTQLPYEPARTRMVEAHKLPAKPVVDYGPRLGSPPFSGAVNRSRSPTTLNNCPLCGCSVCKEHEKLPNQQAP